MVEEWYVHKKTGKKYELVEENLLVKQNGEWNKNFVLYSPLYNNPDGRYFVRTREDFFENFQYMTIKTCPIEDILDEKLKGGYTMSIEEAREELLSGDFDDCDGYVFYCTDTHVTLVEMDEYEVIEGTQRPEFTGIKIYGK